MSREGLMVREGILKEHGATFRKNRYFITLIMMMLHRYINIKMYQIVHF